MAGWTWLSGVVLGAMLVAGCAHTPVRHDPIPLAVNATAAPNAQFAQWLGVASWIISRGSEAVVVDPFFSRPSLLRVAAAQLLPFVAFEPDVERINAAMPRLPDATTLVLVGHGHYDHLMDVGYYASAPNARCITWVGTSTTQNILKPIAANLPFWNADTPASGASLRQCRKGGVRITAVPSDHAPNFLWMELWSGTVDTPLTSPPRRIRDYQDGGAQMYFIDFYDGGATTPAWRVFIGGAASSPAPARTLAGPAYRGFFAERDVDVAILSVPGWNKVDDYPRSILEALRARKAGTVQHVLLSHFDNFFKPYRPGEDPGAGMDFVPLARYREFVRRFHEVNVGFRLHEPRTGECVRFGGSSSKLACER